MAESFDAFARRAEQRLSIALCAAYGPEIGAEATAEALAYAWEHWDRLAEMVNPLGYLYRVGQSKSRRFRWRRPPIAPEPESTGEVVVEPGLLAALRKLSSQQRTGRRAHQ